MTARQLKCFYFPAWRACASANDWVMVRGRLLCDLAALRKHVTEKWEEAGRDAMLMVLATAEQLGRQEHRAVTAEDLRHACNLAATAGRRNSSGDLNNHDVNRVVVLFRLLKEPEDLDAVMEWLHPAIADKRSLVSFIKKQAPEAALSAIASNAYGTIFWEDLEEQKLRWLLKQVKGRKKAFRAPVAAEAVENPF